MATRKNPQIKKFQTALTDEARREANEGKEVIGESITFQIDEDKYTASPPSTTAISILTAIFQSGNDGEVIATVLNLFFPLIENQDESRRLRRRLFDPQDPLDIVTLTEVISDLLEEWTGFPTKPSTAS